MAADASVTKDNFREHYDDAARAAFIVKAERETEADGWKNLGPEKGCERFSKKTDESPHLLFKGFCDFKTEHTVEEVVTWIRNMANMPKTDVMAYDSECVEVYDENHQMNFAHFKTPTPLIYDREMLWLESCHDLGDGARAILGISCEDARKPPPSKWVRGEILTSGYVIRPIEGGMKIFYMAQADPKGWLPVWVTNIVSKDQAYNAGRIRDYLTEHPEELGDEKK